MTADAGFTSNLSDLLARNARYAEEFTSDEMPAAPRRHLAVVACMDARMDVYRILGLGPGESHVIRNAGGIVTDDVIRSLCLSQRLLGTREIMLLHHTNCGLESLSETTLRAELTADTGHEPPWAIGAFQDPYDDVRHSIRRLVESPFLSHKQHIHGFVYDVSDGSLVKV